MAKKTVKKSNVRQDDPYDLFNKFQRDARNQYTNMWTDTYDVEVGRDGDNVAFDVRFKKTGGAAGRTLTKPSTLRNDAEKRTGPRKTKKSSKK
jgi:hypothetical protein